MSRSASVLAAVVLCAMVGSPAIAQDKKAGKAPVRAQKIILDNERVRVTEGVFKPGEENPMMDRSYRVTRVLQGSSSMARTHSNGKVEKLEWKEGGVLASGPDKSSTRNVGKSTVTIYTVTIKQAK